MLCVVASNPVSEVRPINSAMSTACRTFISILGCCQVIPLRGSRWMVVELVPEAPKDRPPSVCDGGQTRKLLVRHELRVRRKWTDKFIANSNRITNKQMVLPPHWLWSCRKLLSNKSLTGADGCTAWLGDKDKQEQGREKGTRMDKHWTVMHWLGIVIFNYWEAVVAGK